ncbi:hypothetical protein VV869_20390, partial [Photobacterium sp. MCCC 1A19761]
ASSLNSGLNVLLLRFVIVSPVNFRGDDITSNQMAKLTMPLHEYLTMFKLETDLSPLRIDDFWQAYNKIPIVNPTQWKFHETVFEEAYYQILRHLSYELERPHSVLITFGFSFADEHLLSLVQRSLSNPSLTMYVSCFNSDELKWMQETFKEYPNVRFIYSDEKILDFNHFNDTQFTLNKPKSRPEEQNEQNEVAEPALAVAFGGNQ